jgi:EAL domain-containing protein (putative c-di-GMP-specific phosphodiesterase class I)
MREACRQASGWHEACPAAANLRLTVNVSARQAAEPSLVETVAGALRDSGLAPQCLGIEITERTMMEEATGSGDTLEQLRELGVRLVIDDFGTGYSSLAYLPRFSLDVLKIDCSFVAALDEDEGSAAINSAILGMASALGLPVIPEGIETESQVEQLRQLGCRFGQGFLLSPPMKADEMMRMLSAESVAA